MCAEVLQKKLLRVAQHIIFDSKTGRDIKIMYETKQSNVLCGVFIF